MEDFQKWAPKTGKACLLWFTWKNCRNFKSEHRWFDFFLCARGSESEGSVTSIWRQLYTTFSFKELWNKLTMEESAASCRCTWPASRRALQTPLSDNKHWTTRRRFCDPADFGGAASMKVLSCRMQFDYWSTDKNQHRSADVFNFRTVDVMHILFCPTVTTV